MSKAGSPTGSAVLDEVASVIGLDAAIALVTSLGGQRLYVPRRFAADSAVVAALGEAAADKLADAYHGSTLEFPIALRREKIVQMMSDQGRTVNQIVAAVGIPRRTVYAIRERLAAGRGQLDLFS